MMRVEKKKLRDVMPYADGKANPWQWWVFDQNSGALVCGPFSKSSEAWECAANEQKESQQSC